MTNQEYCEKLHKREDELRKICNYHNIYGYDADDIIQDLYIKVLCKKNEQINKYSVDGEPNMFIIFMILKNLIFDFRDDESKYSKEPLYDFEVVDEYNTTIDEKYKFIFDEIEKMDGKKDWFDKKIIELYINYNHTIRSLAKETTISTWVIQQVVHNFKDRCKRNYSQSKE